MLVLSLIPRRIHAADNVGEKPQPVVDDRAKARLAFAIVLGVGASTAIEGAMVLGIRAGFGALCENGSCGAEADRGQERLLRIGLALTISGGAISSVGAVGLFVLRAPKLTVGSLSVEPTATLKSLGIRGTF